MWYTDVVWNTISPWSRRPRDRLGGSVCQTAARYANPFNYCYLRPKDEPNGDSKGFWNDFWNGFLNKVRFSAGCSPEFRLRLRPRFRWRRACRRGARHRSAYAERYDQGYEETYGLGPGARNETLNDERWNEYRLAPWTEY
jgi:hypothetical protein